MTIKGELVEKSEKFVENFLERHPDVSPLLYVITGSHAYGFADENSDIDIRGVHVAPMYKFAKIDKPAEAYRLDEDSANVEMEDVDFVSYELRKFGKLLSKMNFNVLELFTDGILISEKWNKIGHIYSDIQQYIQHEAPKHYYGMARHNYEKYVANPERDTYTPIAKKYLYVFRGIFGACYSYSRGEIEANLAKMAAELEEWNVGKFIKELMAYKKMYGDEPLPKGLRKKAKEYIEPWMSILDGFDFGEIDRGELIRTIDDWMLEVREGVNFLKTLHGDENEEE